MAACKVCKKSEVSMLCICEDCFNEIDKVEKLIATKMQVVRTDSLSEDVSLLCQTLDAQREVIEAFVKESDYNDVRIKELSERNREFAEELKKTRTAIKNGLEFGYIYRCNCSYEWLARVEKLLEKYEGVY